MGDNTYTGKDVNEARAKSLAMFDRKVVRLEDISTDLTKLLGRAVDGLKEQMFQGLGYKSPVLSLELVKLLKEVTAAFNTASDAQVRLDKTAGQRAKQMTHDDRKKAVADFICTLPVRERAEWLVELVARHDALKSESGGRPLASKSIAALHADKDPDEGA